MTANAAPNTRRHKRGKCKLLALLVGSLLLGLCLAEAGVRAFVDVRNVGPSFVVHDPAYGRRLKRNASFTSSSAEFSFQFTTNSLGLRDLEWSELPANVVLCLGDSFTMGYGVSDEAAFPRVTQQLLNENQGWAKQPTVVNAGIGNAGTGHWLKFLRRDARRFSPQCVVLQLSSNDFSDDMREGLFRLDAETLTEQILPAPGWDWTIQEWVDAVPLVSKSHLVALIRQGILMNRLRQTRDSNGTGIRTPASRNLTWRLLEESLGECRRQGWPVIAFSVNCDEIDVLQFERICREQGAKTIVAPRKSERPDLYFRVDGHWRASGHEHIAKKLVDVLGATLLRR